MVTDVSHHQHSRGIWTMSSLISFNNCLALEKSCSWSHWSLVGSFWQLFYSISYATKQGMTHTEFWWILQTEASAIGLRIGHGRAANKHCGTSSSWPSNTGRALGHLLCGWGRTMLSHGEQQTPQQRCGDTLLLRDFCLFKEIPYENPESTTVSMFYYQADFFFPAHSYIKPHN